MLIDGRRLAVTLLAPRGVLVPRAFCRYSRRERGIHTTETGALLHPSREFPVVGYVSLSTYSDRNLVYGMSGYLGAVPRGEDVRALSPGAGGERRLLEVVRDEGPTTYVVRAAREVLIIEDPRLTPEIWAPLTVDGVTVGIQGDLLACVAILRDRRAGRPRLPSPRALLERPSRAGGHHRQP